LDYVKKTKKCQIKVINHKQGKTVTGLVLKSSSLELSRVPPGNCAITLIPDLIPDLNEEHAWQCQFVIQKTSAYH